MRNYVRHKKKGIYLHGDGFPFPIKYDVVL